MTEVDAARPPGVRRLAAAVAVLIGIVLVFAAIRVVSDGPHILAGTRPDDEFAERYVAHPWTAYLHIVPGVVYLLGAPLQLSRTFRRAHFTLHRRLGRVLLGCALLSGVMALAFGVPQAWGGAPEAVATVLFGGWFLVSLVLAFRAIRRGDGAAHRRWMVRAFAVGTGIGTIRIWVGLFLAIATARTGEFDVPARGTFALSFWLALSMHVLVGEWWLRRTPPLDH